MRDHASVRLPLTTDRLTMRAHEPDDAGWLQRIYSRPEVARYLLDEPWTDADATRHVSKRLEKTDLDGDAGALALVIEHEGSPVGDVVLWFTDAKNRVAEIGWVLDPQRGGKGLAREAAGEVLRVAFEDYQVHRVTAQMDSRNTSSARLAAALGMRQEAHFRQGWWSKGEWVDTLVFALLSSDR